MVARVATFSQSSRVLEMALNTQAKLAKIQEQQASGLESSDYGGFSSDAGTVVDLSVSIERSYALIDTAELLVSRSELISAALGDMSDLLTNMRSSVNGTMSDEDLDSLQIEAEAALEDLVSLVNTQYQGRYLFAGSLTETAPADISNYSATDLYTENTDYYLGDDYIQSARLDVDSTISYGITGDNEGIEMAMRALSYLADASPLTTDVLTDVSELLVDAQDAILAAQSASGIATNRLENYIETESNFVAAAEDLATDLTSVDIAAVTVEATAYETQLEASYSALSVIANLNLLDYLNL